MFDIADIEPDGPAVASAPVWSFNRQGPFYRLQRRLGLLDDTDLAAPRRALLFAGLALIPAIALAAIEGHVWGDHYERAILLDFSVYAFGLAIAAFVLMEQTSDRRMARLVARFLQSGIAVPAARPCFVQARERLERRSGYPAVEAGLLLLAYLLAWIWIQAGIERVPSGTWFAVPTDGGARLTLAGWWTLLVALPIFWFLLLRWLWRFAVWGLLLRDVARCELKLVATHPDRCGGLAFVGQYPKTYVLFVFAMSAVVSATVLKQIVFAGASLATFKFALFGMIAFLLAAFAAPLFFFSPLLIRLKRQGLGQYGTLASRHNLAFEARWIEGAGSDEGHDPLGAPDISSLADLAAGYQLVKDMRPVPLTKESLLPLLLAALVPMVPVAATQVPLAKVLAEAKALLLL